MAFLLSLFGCKQRQPNEPSQTEGESILDGTGSVAPTPWRTMELSRSGDMYYPYNFNFTVTLDGGRYLATGYCADEDGNRYETEDGVEIPLAVIDGFDLGSLSNESRKGSSDAFIMDAAIISLTLTYADGTQVNKIGRAHV